MPTATPTPSPLPPLPLHCHCFVHCHCSFHCHCTCLPSPLHCSPAIHRHCRRVTVPPSITDDVALSIVVAAVTLPSCLPLLYHCCPCALHRHLGCHPAIHHYCRCVAVPPSIVVFVVPSIAVNLCCPHALHCHRVVHRQRCHCIAVAPSITVIAFALPSYHLSLPPLHRPLVLCCPLLLLLSRCCCAVYCRHCRCIAVPLSITVATAPSTSVAPSIAVAAIVLPLRRACACVHSPPLLLPSLVDCWLFTPPAEGGGGSGGILSSPASCQLLSSFPPSPPPLSCLPAGCHVDTSTSCPLLPLVCCCHSHGLLILLFLSRSIHSIQRDDSGAPPPPPPSPPAGAAAPLAICLACFSSSAHTAEVAVLHFASRARRVGGGGRLQLVAILGGYCWHYTCKVDITPVKSAMEANVMTCIFDYTVSIFEYTCPNPFSISHENLVMKNQLYTCKIGFTYFQYYRAAIFKYTLKIKFCCYWSLPTNNSLSLVICQELKEKRDIRKMKTKMLCANTSQIDCDIIECSLWDMIRQLVIQKNGKEVHTWTY